MSVYFYIFSHRSWYWYNSMACENMWKSDVVIATCVYFWRPAASARSKLHGRRIRMLQSDALIIKPLYPRMVRTQLQVSSWEFVLRSVFTWLEGISKEAYVTTLSGIDQRRVDVLCDHDQKVPTKDFCPSVTSQTQKNLACLFWHVVIC